VARRTGDDGGAQAARAGRGRGGGGEVEERGGGEERGDARHCCCCVRGGRSFELGFRPPPSERGRRAPYPLFPLRIGSLTCGPREMRYTVKNKKKGEMRDTTCENEVQTTLFLFFLEMEWNE
jgi:hypothetical protein